MDLPLSRAATPRLVVVPSTGSTNDDLRDRATQEPDFSVLVTDDQRAGRGRSGREWVAPAGRTLAISVLLTPSFGVERFGWIPLIAGVAMVRAVRVALPGRPVGLKWPNDPQVDGRKIGGILAELVPAGVVVGAGLNVAFTADELPTPTATSLLVEGAGPRDALADLALSSYLRALRELYDRLTAAGGDAEASGIRSLVVAECRTIGRDVRVELPDGSAVHGVATGIDRDGRLEVQPSDGSATLAVAAGDVTHLRYE